MFLNPGGLCFPFQRPCPKAIYVQQAEQNNENIFTNDHIIIF